LSHGDNQPRIRDPLGQHVYAHDLGELLGEATGFLLERGPEARR